MFVKRRLVGCAVQLSRIKQIFLPRRQFSRSQSLKNSEISNRVIHAFLLALYSTGRFFTPRRHRGFLLFPMITGRLFPLPSMLQASKIVNRAFSFFLPETLSFLKVKVASGVSRHYRAVLAALKMLAGAYSLSNSGRTSDIQRFDSLTSECNDSPCISLYTILLRFSR